MGIARKSFTHMLPLPSTRAGRPCSLASGCKISSCQPTEPNIPNDPLKVQNGPKRLDCLVTGRDDMFRDQAVIVELKQWDKCEESDEAGR